MAEDFFHLSKAERYEALEISREKPDGPPTYFRSWQVPTRLEFAIPVRRLRPESRRPRRETGAK